MERTEPRKEETEQLIAAVRMTATSHELTCKRTTSSRRATSRPTRLRRSRKATSLGLPYWPTVGQTFTELEVKLLKLSTYYKFCLNLANLGYCMLLLNALSKNCHNFAKQCRQVQKSMQLRNGGRAAPQPAAEAGAAGGLPEGPRRGRAEAPRRGEGGE